MVMFVVAALLVIVVMFVVAALLVIVMMSVVTTFPVVVMMFVVAALLVIVMMSVMATFLVVMVMFVVFPANLLLFFILYRKAFEFCLQRVLLFHGGKDSLSFKLFPRCGNKRRGRIFFAKQFDTGGEFFLGYSVRMRKDDAGGIFHLIVEKFAEIFHIHLTFSRVDDGAECIENGAFQLRIGNGFDHVTEFSDSGRFDHNPVGMIFRFDFFERFGEIPDQRTTDTTGIHFRNFYSGVLQKSAVNPDFAEFVFNQYDLFARVGFLYQFFDESGFTRS